MISDTRTSSWEMATASPDELGFDATRLDRLDDCLEQLVHAGQHAAVAVTVIRHDRLVHARSVGRQQVDSAEPLRDDAIIRLASMTKPIAGVAMMLLYEQGGWQLD